jgi:hypothetical protein
MQNPGVTRIQLADCDLVVTVRQAAVGTQNCGHDY